MDTKFGWNDFETLIKTTITETVKEAMKESLKANISITENEKATLTIQECVDFTGIGRDKLMELAHNENSDFPSFKVGIKFLINREMLILWLEKITQEKRTL